jgi:hypothetical protein
VVAEVRYSKVKVWNRFASLKNVDDDDDDDDDDDVT